MNDKPSPNRHKFTSVWDEIGYLYDKLLYWLYQREEAAKAHVFADRLERLLKKVAPDHQAIFGEECWSLIFESKGELQKAIKHREIEIRLIRRLQQISRDTPFEREMFKDYGYDDLSDRLDLLATLYHDSGQMDKAITVLNESKQLCEVYGINFDGNDILQEYLAEKYNGRPLGKTRRD